MLAAAGICRVLQGAQSSPWSVVVLMVCLQLDPIRTAACPAPCLCAADLLSCSGQGLGRVPVALPVYAATLDLNHNQIPTLEDGSFQGLLQLEVLRLAHNKLDSIHPGAFRNSSGGLLRHLDLSSNRLHALMGSDFQELSGLEELLLFNNRIANVESSALSGLGTLQKAYLSHNRLTDFPFFSIQRHSHPRLSLLDLSSNRMPKLPLADISNLPPPLQEGLYLHNNPLLCDCAMYSLFSTWERKDFASVRIFREEHVCLVQGVDRNGIRFLQHRGYFKKCNALMEQEPSVSVRVGAPLRLHCTTPLSEAAGTSFFWLTPLLEYVAPPGNNGSLRMLANGSLEIVAAKTEDTGIYVCVAQDGRRNESLEVNVTVVPHRDPEAAEPFNTGFTTLLGCVVTLLLVLVYLYLTPCRCPPWPRPRAPSTAAAPSQGKEGAMGSGQSSILTPTPPTTTEGPGGKVSTNKHVVFLEPIREQQNGRPRLGAAPQLSVFSNTHTMLL